MDGGVESGGIDGRLGLGVDQTPLIGPCDGRAEQQSKAPFLPRRFWA
jgi:hypothetical protein